MAEMTFMPGRQGSSKRSHTAGASGLAWRLISSVTVLVAMIPFAEDFLFPSGAEAPCQLDLPYVRAEARTLQLFRRRVTAWARLDELRVHIFVLEARAFGRAGEAGLGGLQKLFVVAIRK